MFDSLHQVDGKITGDVAKKAFIKTKLPSNVLAAIWRLADVDKDGKLTRDEFALMNYLCKLKSEKHEIPSELPPHLIPPNSF